MGRNIYSKHGRNGKGRFYNLLLKISCSIILRSCVPQRIRLALFHEPFERGEHMKISIKFDLRRRKLEGEHIRTENETLGGELIEGECNGKSICGKIT